TGSPVAATREITMIAGHIGVWARRLVWHTGCIAPRQDRARHAAGRRPPIDVGQRRSCHDAATGLLRPLLRALAEFLKTLSPEDLRGEKSGRDPWRCSVRKR